MSTVTVVAVTLTLLLILHIQVVEAFTGHTIARNSGLYSSYSGLFSSKSSSEYESIKDIAVIASVDGRESKLSDISQWGEDTDTILICFRSFG